MDKIRHLLMEKWYRRRTISRKMRGLVLPHIMKKLKEESFNLDMDVFPSSDEVAEVCVKGSSGFKCVVNLQERTCSCRKFQVSCIPCKHAIAFITKMGQPLENYVDSYYTVEKFRAAYENLIPALTDKAQWQQSDHGFFMHPPLLKSTAGRRKNQRFKGCTETTTSTTCKKGQHRCDVCKVYGHRWYTCKEGGLQKRRIRKQIKPLKNQLNIVLAASGPTPMYFPPSQGCSTKLNSGKSEKSGCDSSQPDALSQPSWRRKREGKAKAKAKNTKGAATTCKKQSIVPVPPQSPAMCTRSKTPESPAMSTRSKRNSGLNVQLLPPSFAICHESCTICEGKPCSI